MAVKRGEGLSHLPHLTASVTCVTERAWKDCILTQWPIDPRLAYPNTAQRRALVVFCYEEGMRKPRLQGTTEYLVPTSFLPWNGTAEHVGAMHMRRSEPATVFPEQARKTISVMLRKT